MKLNSKTLKLATLFAAVTMTSACSTVSNTYGQIEGTVNDSISDAGCSMRGGDWYSADTSNWGYAGGSKAKYKSNVGGRGAGKCITNEAQKESYRIRALKFYARSAQSEITTQSSLNKTACNAFAASSGQMQTCRGIYDAGREAGRSVLSMSEKEMIKLKTDTYVQASVTYRNCLANDDKSFGKCFVDYSNQISATPKQQQKWAAY